MSRRPLTVVMQRAHRRAALLDRTLRFYERLGRSDAPVEIALMADRPTADVREVIKLHRNNLARVIECPFPMVSFEGGQRWMEASNYHLANGVEPLEPVFVIFSDDDRWPEASYAQEHLALVGNSDVDMWYARSLFFWNETQVRADFFDHNSVYLWRHRPGDRFDEKMLNQAPAGVHADALANGRHAQLKARLLDYGYASTEERAACFASHKESGRLDKVVLHLLDKNPVLRPYECPEETR